MDLALLGAYGWQGLVLVVWIALSVGSFLNVVIYRLPVMLKRDWEAQAREILELEAVAEGEKFNLSVPRSRCPNCGHQIRFWENIPVISWLVLRARCSGCAAPISWRYPAIELLTCLLSLAALATFGMTTYGFAVVLATWLLVAATFIDFDTQLLPDQLTYPLLWPGLLTNTFLITPVAWLDALVGAVVGYLFLWSIYWGFKLLTGKEGMGYGDFKLFAAIGAWAGWQTLPAVILIAAVAGLLVALTSMAVSKEARENAGSPMAFGPYLAIAGWVALIFRDTVRAVFVLY